MFHKMRRFNFFQLDVFTSEAFKGNPLAVFPEAEGLTDEEMQRIAREMNLSETVFVLPSTKERALRRLRIFTTMKELPMAGHPVVGTWNLLAREGVIENAPTTGRITIEHELGIGVLPVEIEFADGKPLKVTMTQGKFTAGETIEDENLRRRIAEAFNLTIDALAPDAPIQVAGTGVNFLIVPVCSIDALKNCRADAAKLEKLPKDLGGEFSLFTRETLEHVSKIHTRMFAPAFGIIEDPATGSAAGTLGGYLVHHGLLEEETKIDGAFRFIIEQGDFIERPSRIEVEVRGKRGEVEIVRVGGASVVVARGELMF
ncbi:MAG: PhzF family phenazine biosynthesis protein [Pyrinomonadaceae bacterium]|nr:PhzF family phenazine biosynthesis protein [Pyrinomonadaceae bacterium]